jgi:ankyrin repeat protein
MRIIFTKFTLLLILLATSLFHPAKAQDICLTSLEKEVIDAINKHRTSKNLNELNISRTLMITANKNMENLVNKNYTILKVSEFGDYTSETAYIRTSTSVSSAADIIRTLTTPSQYTQHSKIIENSGDYTKFNWKTVGICIRNTGDKVVPTSIIIYFGEKNESAVNFSECPDEIYFSLNKNSYRPPLNYPILRFTAPEEVSVFSTYTDASGKRKKLNDGYGGFEVFESGSKARASLNEPGAKFFEVFISPFIPSILEQEDFIIKIFPNEVQDTIFKTVELKGNSLEEVKEYLSNGGNINAQDEYGYTILLRAAWRDSAEIVDFILGKGADVNILSKMYESPLTFTKSEKVYDLLMTKNPKTDLPLEPTSKQTLLHSFSSNGILKGVKYLIEEKKVNIDLKDSKGATGLYYSVDHNHIEVARYLLEKGAKQTKGWGTFPVHEALENKNYEMLDLLFEYGAKEQINSLTESGYALIHLALKENDLEMVKYLVEKGASVNTKDYDGKTPLNYCNELIIKPEIKTYLISKGAK